MNVQSVIKNDLEQVENILNSVLTESSYEKNVNALCLQVVKAGGKRLRPRLAMLVAHALNTNIDAKLFYDFAAAIELLHTASLVHDDVIDKATMRRGKPTLNDTSGNHAAVLAGDYLFTKCFTCLQSVQDSIGNKIFNAVSNTLAALVIGELNQLEKQGDLDITLDDYKLTIYRKTGALFELACYGSALIAEQSQEVMNALSTFGKELGIAFQVADDILDYSSDSKTLGKSIGEDLEDGRITLPLIIALRECSFDKLDDLKSAIEQANLEKVSFYLEQTHALEKCYDFAMQAAKRAQDALDILDESEYKTALQELLYKAVNRKN